MTWSFRRTPGKSTRVAAYFTLIVASAWTISTRSTSATPSPSRSTKAPDAYVDLVERFKDLEAAGDYESAQPLIERACTLIENLNGPRTTQLAECLNYQAKLYAQQGHHRDAEPLYQRSLAIWRETRGDSDAEVAKILNNLAYSYSSLGQFEKAGELHEQALTIWEQTIGPDHPDFAAGLVNLAFLRAEQGHYNTAEDLYLQAITAYKRSLGPDDLLVAGAMSSLGVVYWEQGRLDDAQPLHERAIAIYEQKVGLAHPDLATILNNLALTIEDRGRYSEAEALYLRALSIHEGALDADHPSIAQDVNNLAIIRMKQGEYEDADGLFERAIGAWTRALGAQHPHVAISMVSRADLLRLLGRIDEALATLERAIEIQRRALGENHPLLAASLHNLARIRLERGELDMAKVLYQQSLDIMREQLGDGHPRVVKTLDGLAVVNFEFGEYDKAESLIQRSLEIGRSRLGSEHPNVAKSLHNLGRLHVTTGRIESALELHREALEIEEKNLKRTLTVAAESRRLAFAATLVDSTHDVLSLHFRAAPNTENAANLALTTVMRRKGRILDLMTQTRAALRRSLPPEAQGLLDDLAAAQARHSALVNRGARGLTSAELRRRIDAELEEQDRIWRQLAEASPLAGSFDEPATIAEVQAALPSDTVFIEIVRFEPRHDEHGRHVGGSGSAHYAAYLVFTDHIEWTELAAEPDVKRLVSAFRDRLLRRQESTTDLYDTLVRPLTERVGEARRLVIAPAGVLHLVPFAAVYDGEHYLVERYEIGYAAAARNLVDPLADTLPTGGPVVVANPTGAGLSGTEHEADLFAKIFPYATILRGTQATEHRLLSEHSPSILHLATHGFFMHAPERASSKGASRSSLHPYWSRRDNPMLHSGLQLAEAQDTEPGSRDDGRLTAYEVSGWDLRGTELVVLSACDTGMGEPQVGEGVLGLQRAFAMAGARTQVMSLWKVSDYATPRLMSSYYNKLVQGQGRLTAMRQAQLEMLLTKEHAHPKDWGAFIVVGDPGPLPSRDGVHEGPTPITPAGCCHRASIGKVSSDRSALVLLILIALGLRPRRNPTKYLD